MNACKIVEDLLPLYEEKLVHYKRSNGSSSIYQTVPTAETLLLM